VPDTRLARAATELVIHLDTLCPPIKRETELLEGFIMSNSERLPNVVSGLCLMQVGVMELKAVAARQHGSPDPWRLSESSGTSCRELQKSRSRLSRWYGPGIEAGCSPDRIA
jgi:hypothetical protein